MELTLIVHRASVTMPDGATLMAEDWPDSAATLKALSTAYNLILSDPWDLDELASAVAGYIGVELDRPFGCSLTVYCDVTMAMED